MRILVLDDMEVRHDGFNRRFKDHKIDHAYTVEEAVFYLNLRKYDLVCLDHDLEDIHYSQQSTNAQERTGFDVAVFISEMNKDGLPTQIIIHSWNPIGAERMYNQLQGLGMFVSRKPF